MFTIEVMPLVERLKAGLSDEDWSVKFYKIVRDDGKVVDSCLSWERAQDELELYEWIEYELEQERECEDI